MELHATTDSQRTADLTAGVLRDEGRRAAVVETAILRYLDAVVDVPGDAERFAVVIEA